MTAAFHADASETLKRPGGGRQRACLFIPRRSARCHLCLAKGKKMSRKKNVVQIMNLLIFYTQ